MAAVPFPPFVLPSSLALLPPSLPLTQLPFSFLLPNPHFHQLESFYKDQADLYDSYRFRMLHARLPMIKAMPLPPKGKGVWLDIGGGKTLVVRVKE